MNTDNPSAIEATDALEATQDDAPAAPSPGVGAELGLTEGFHTLDSMHEDHYSQCI